MTVKELLAALYMQPETLRFEQVLAAIDAEFDVTASAFIVGSVHNSASENQNSCKVLAFAHQAGLAEKLTLQLFAEHYQAVLADPDGNGHQNIRQFMAHGWHKVSFAGRVLVAKSAQR